MAEKVSTGGVKSFTYTKEHNPRLTSEQKQEIREAYQHYDERKARQKKEKRTRIIIISIIILILIILAVLFLRKS